LDAVRAFGRLLTDPPGPVVDGAMMRPAVLQKLVASLLVPRARSVLVVSAPGTGKTALAAPLARRNLDKPELLPEALRTLELLELSPEFPRLPGDTGPDLNPAIGLQRVRQLFRTLQDNPQVVLVIGNMVPFLATLFGLGMQQELLEAFKRHLEE